MMRWLVLLACACGGKAVVAPPPSNHLDPVAAPRDLAASLRAAAGGQPIYFAAGPKGLVARGADQAWSQVLAPGKIDAALYQPEERLIWFLARGQLSVLDLDGDGAPIPIATGIAVPAFAISAHDNRVEASVLDEIDNENYPFFEIVIDRASATMDVEDTPSYGDVVMGDADAQRESLAQAKLVGADWLRAQASRAPTQIAHATWDSSDDCDACEAAPFGKPALHEELVFQLVTCDDNWCTGGCSLYRSGKEDESAPVVDCATSLDASETQWLAGTELCAADGCIDAGGTPLGWLDPSQVFDDPSYRKDIEDYE